MKHEKQNQQGRAAFNERRKLLIGGGGKDA
jgi:hypothetical protein